MTFTRRQFSLQIASGLSLSRIALAAPQKHADEISHAADAIHQEVNFSAEPKKIYAALLDTKQFDEMMRLIPSMQSAKLGNSPTEISSELGGTFTLFRGHIIGRHLEFVPNQRIVQAWRVVDCPRCVLNRQI
jgi:activator of HSP90 ATPase